MAERGAAGMLAPMHSAILLPGSVLPKELAYGALVEALGEEVRALPKDLDLYSTEAPPSGYGLELELQGVSREADAAGFQRFHLVGYSGGGAAALAFASRNPDRLHSLALLEPAWMGNEDLSDDERALWDDLERMAALPPERLMPAFVRASLAPGVEVPAPSAGPPPPWMAQRPAGIQALIAAFMAFELDLDPLRSFAQPVYYALGGLSNPRYYGRMAEHARQIFKDFTLDVFEERHHFDPPHRAEPDRLARRLKGIWRRAEGAVPV